MANKPADQAFFDATVKHLMQQTSAAIGDDSETCVYYEPTTGNRCAVGAQLKLETAIALSEQEFIKQLGGSWSDVCNHADSNEVAKQAVKELALVSFKLLADLQQVHDRTAWRKRTDDDKIDLLILLKACAAKHGLVWR